MAMNEKTRFVKEKTGLTLKELAVQIGYNENTLVQGLRGQIQTGYKLAKILAERTGASPIYFMEK